MQAAQADCVVSYSVGCQVGAEEFWVCAHVMEGPKVGVRRLVVCTFVFRLKHLSDHIPCWCWFNFSRAGRALLTLIYLVPEGKN